MKLALDPYMFRDTPLLGLPSWSGPDEEELPPSLSHTRTTGRRTASGLRYIANPPGSQLTVHQHLDIGQGDADFHEFFGGRRHPSSSPVTGRTRHTPAR